MTEQKGEDSQRLLQEAAVARRPTSGGDRQWHRHGADDSLLCGTLYLDIFLLSLFSFGLVSVFQTNFM